MANKKDLNTSFGPEKRNISKLTKRMDPIRESIPIKADLLCIVIKSKKPLHVKSCCKTTHNKTGGRSKNIIYNWIHRTNKNKVRIMCSIEQKISPFNNNMINK